MHLCRDREARRRNSSQGHLSKVTKVYPSNAECYRTSLKTGAKMRKARREGNYFAHDQFVPKVTRPNRPASGEPTRTREKNENANRFSNNIDQYNLVVHHKNSNISTLNVKKICSISKLAANSFFRPVLDLFFTQHIE